MREEAFAGWMKETGRKKDGTERKTQIGDIKKIDRVFGDLDQQYEKDRLQGVIEKLTYSDEDVVNKREYYSDMRFQPRVPKSDEEYFRKLQGTFENSRALVERYIRFRDDSPDSVGDIPAIAADTAKFDPRSAEDAREKILRSIIARRGQRQFRAKLCRAYGNACAISGCSVLDVLEAAHIARYLGPHTNHVTNGLLLRTDLHTLFDCGLITVEPISLHVIVKPSLFGSMYGAFHMRPLRPATQNDLAPNPEALRQHKTEVYDTRAI